MTGGTATERFTGYDDVRTRAAVYDRGTRGIIALSGADAVSFLHNVLTNDIASLPPGRAVYAAYLTPQGRMISDATVMRREVDVVLEVEPAVHAAVAARLDGSIFSEDVRIRDRSGELVSFAVYGPEAWSAVSGLIGAERTEPLPEHVHLTTGGRDDETLVLAVASVAPGLHVFAPGDRAAALLDTLGASGAPFLSRAAWEALRIESGTPVFGVDMTDETIPLEAGIQDHAISMTKGCYVGQEVIIRILHRGQGRVARKLVGLVIEGEVVPRAGAALAAGGKDSGHITSAAFSPRLDRPIALGYVQRAVAEPGTILELKESGQSAVVSPFPLTRRPL